jgi:hypothetical protein
LLGAAVAEQFKLGLGKSDRREEREGEGREQERWFHDRGCFSKNMDTGKKNLNFLK